jgi:hypothetical protein
MLEKLADDQGVVLRRHALALGYTDNWLRRQLRSGALVRIRHGAYVLGERWAAASRVDRHLLLTHAVLGMYGDGVALSHITGSIWRGSPNWGMDLENVHLTSLFGKGERMGAGVVHHRGVCRVNDITRDRGVWITTPARTALESALVLDRDPAVCLLDWYLHEKHVTREDLERQHALMADWGDALSLHQKIALSDGRSESIGEGRSRLIFVDHGVPKPEVQFPIYHPNGQLAGRCDFGWPKLGLLGEFDGKQKYLELRRPGETVAQAVLREKNRENLLRELTGCAMIRWDWADLERPQELVDRIMRMLTRRAA